MYRHCIYCSAELGTNEALEAFPVGRGIAFDAARGRLWAICPKCARWNLSPIEERWEPVEQAERLFRDARLRAQSENIGLARLPDGTRLIRVGDALAGEVAAWRYGDQLVRRRKQYLIASAAAGVVAAAVVGGVAMATAGGAVFGMFANLSDMVRQWQRQRVFHHVPRARSGYGVAVTLRRWHLEGARLLPGSEGTLALEIPFAVEKRAPVTRWGTPRVDPDPLVLPDAEARAALTRGTVHLNSQGANRRRVGEALELLARSGSAEHYLRDVAAERQRLTRGAHARDAASALRAPQQLALEMALHEEQERRALEGELAVLEAAWRDAEEIAGIADRLALVPGA